ncbi:hypothetical protein G6O69_22310 [Pseudenhygromyxa sp. WMMC2535]|uniref:hypothetical protein n=1 Tax=Pseudenhygromyxa sp. WMMC2535 TaxID=2712867 RepID=UPI0015516B43|nr:hypothetical protein [Pseudenhygromyxa sp. WMMC2535]NVB40590.1 hypothetical protein [Pseudenhygromyxa sp. WMMC2535]
MLAGRRKIAGLLTGLCSGLVVALLVPGGGCLGLDYCIRINYSGIDWCMWMEGALMWPEGQPELAEPVAEEIFSCVCFNDAEETILNDAMPEEQYGALVAEIEQSARESCAALVPDGFSHNCDEEEGDDSPGFTLPIAGESTKDCVGHCEFVNPPPGGSCRELDPYECNDEEADGGSDETGSDDAGDEAEG